MALKVEKKWDGRTITLKLKGILDITTEHLLTSHLASLDEGVDRLVLDFSDLELLDSTGIGALLNAIHVAGEKRFKIAICGTNPTIEQTLETVGLYEILAAVQGESV